MNRLAKREEERKKTVPLEEELLSAGFEPVWIERSKWKIPVSETVREVSLTGDPVELSEPIIGEDLIQIFGISGLYILRKPIQ